MAELVNKLPGQNPPCGPQIIVDLAGLESIDSSGVAALVRGRNLAARRHAVRSARPGKGTPSAEEAAGAADALPRARTVEPASIL
jgi:hypothetical protein